MRALRDDERGPVGAMLAYWLIHNAVEVALAYPTGTNFVPVGIDNNARLIKVRVEKPARFDTEAVRVEVTTEIPMMAGAF